jgi:hypothetical protein
VNSNSQPTYRPRKNLQRKHSPNSKRATGAMGHSAAKTKP